MGTALKEEQSKTIEVEDRDSEEKQEIVDIEEVVGIINESNMSNTQKIKVMSLVTQKEEYSGPIPHPDHLRQYEEISHGSADRLITMAEKQSDHRQETERTVIKAEILYKKRGQIFGFILAIICLICGFVLLFMGKNTEGFSTIIGTIGVMVGAFVYGNRTKK